jgi:hypothetical protein
MTPIDITCRIPADHPALSADSSGERWVPGVVLLELAERQARALGGFRATNTEWRGVSFPRAVAAEEAIRLRIDGGADRFSFTIDTEGGQRAAAGRCRHRPVD